MVAAGRLLLIGGHEFNRRAGNAALCDLVVELTGEARPRICLLPTASGDPEDQIASFRRAFGERDCEPSAISLFRLGTNPVDLREHLLSQDAIYVGGGSMVNLLAIWRAHGLGEILRRCLHRGILVCGQSAGAMCWFESGVTRSRGVPAAHPGLGVLAGSACVHYVAEPERREFFRRAIAAGRMAPGLGIEDQAAVLYEDGAFAEAISARPGAGVWGVAPDPRPSAEIAAERAIEARRLSDRLPAIDARGPEIQELRETLALRAASRRPRRRGQLSRLD